MNIRSKTFAPLAVARGHDQLRPGIRQGRPASGTVINKRAGGMELISGRKAFQKPMQDSVVLLNAIQDVYASKAVMVA